MTANQLAFATLEEQKRHNAAMEAEDFRHNTSTENISAKQAKTAAKSAKYSKEHYERQDTLNREHYERSDAITKEHYNVVDPAALTSANASAMNAETNRLSYGMQHDIQYGWTGNEVYPKGMPLDAQLKNVQGYYNIVQTEIAKAEQKKAEAEAEIKQIEADYAKAQHEASIANQVVTAVTNIEKAVFGNGGLINAFVQ